MPVPASTKSLRPVGRGAGRSVILALCAVAVADAAALRSSLRSHEDSQANGNVSGSSGANLSNAMWPWDDRPLPKPSVQHATQPHVSPHGPPAQHTAAGGGGAAARAPRVYFLFLAVDKVSNLKVWSSFFSSASASNYRAFVHCKLPACNAMVAGSPLIAVPTVPSYYCTDLVSPMNQLLSFALSQDHGDANPLDKFAFVSDSTLPAKSFAHIHAALSSRQGSDFCVFPSTEWADRHTPQGLEMAPKHHQWITLERQHAEKAASLWAGGHLHNFMGHFQMNMQAWTYNNNTFADGRNFGCLDEFWHMAALYGTMSHINPNRMQTINLAMFSGGPLSVDRTAGWQGMCDTFVIWAKYMHAPGNNPFEKLHWSLDSLSIPHGGNDQRPGWWDSISTTGIRAIRNSDFLFVRKFIDNPQLAGGGDFGATYSQIVFT